MENAFCTWAVCHDIDGSNYDDGEKRTRICAIFNYPFAAEDFITKCLPAENRSRFYIKHLRCCMVDLDFGGEK